MGCTCPARKPPRSGRPPVWLRLCSPTFRPWYEPDRVLAEATPHFDGPVSLAKPGAVWDIGAV